MIGMILIGATLVGLIGLGVWSYFADMKDLQEFDEYMRRTG